MKPIKAGLKSLTRSFRATKIKTRQATPIKEAKADAKSSLAICFAKDTKLLGGHYNKDTQTWEPNPKEKSNRRQASGKKLQRANTARGNLGRPAMAQAPETPSHVTEKEDRSAESSKMDWSDSESKMPSWLESSDEAIGADQQHVDATSSRKVSAEAAPVADATQPADLQTLDEIAQGLMKKLPKNAANDLTLGEMAKNRLKKEAKLKNDIAGLKSLGAAARRQLPELKDLFTATQSQRDCFNAEEWAVLERHASQGNRAAFGDEIFEKAFALNKKLQKMGGAPSTSPEA